MNVALLDQGRVVLQAESEVLAPIESLPERISSLQGSVGNVDFEGSSMRVNSFGHEIIVKSCLLGLVCMNIYLAKLAGPSDLDNASTGVVNLFSPFP